MKKIIAMILLAAMLLTLAACGAPAEEGPEKALVGTWKNADGGEMEFKTDGSGTCFTKNGLSTSCTWTYESDSGEFVIKAMAFGQERVTITDDTITWFDVAFTKAG